MTPKSLTFLQVTVDDQLWSVLGFGSAAGHFNQTGEL